jgi:hypothetical protein
MFVCVITNNSLNKIFPEVLKNANQQLITLADQKIETGAIHVWQYRKYN